MASLVTETTLYGCCSLATMSSIGLETYLDPTSKKRWNSFLHRGLVKQLAFLAIILPLMIHPAKDILSWADRVQQDVDTRVGDLEDIAPKQKDMPATEVLLNPVDCNLSVIRDAAVIQSKYFGLYVTGDNIATYHNSRALERRRRSYAASWKL